MPKVEELARLIPLLDAESEHVRQLVKDQLADYCPFMDDMMAHLDLDLTAHQHYQLHRIQTEFHQRNMAQTWRRILASQGGLKRMESALEFICHLQVDEYPYEPIGPKLDAIASAYRRQSRVADPIDLAHFIFRNLGFHGARQDYDNPLNANMAYVLNERKGIPISLAMVLILVAFRVGLRIDGVNLPGHFLAKTVIGGRNILFDGFQGGNVLGTADLASMFMTPAVDFVALLRRPPSVPEMAQRCLRNLASAYDMRGMIEKLELVRFILQRQGSNEFQIQLVQESARPRFQPGHLVRHRRYDYRGVIVDLDESCMADEFWYQSTHTEPDRNQAWYHVLVDGSHATTYAAQSHLELDNDLSEVDHPLIPFFFNGFNDGLYRRNLEPWYWKKQGRQPP